MTSNYYRQKLIIVPILLVLFSVGIVNTSFAQEIETTNLEEQTEEEQIEELSEDNQPAEIEDSSALRAEFRQYTQNPGSKKIKFEMILKPQITTDRLRVDWIITGDSVVVEDYDTSLIIPVEAGGEYVVPIEIIPATRSASGGPCCISEVFGRAQVTRIDGTISTTVRKNFASNTNQEILPITDEYKRAQTQKTILEVIAVVLFISALSVAAFFGFKYFYKWYTKDEVKAFEQRHPGQAYPGSAKRLTEISKTSRMSNSNSIKPIKQKNR